MEIKENNFYVCGWGSIYKPLNPHHVLKACLLMKYINVINVFRSSKIQGDIVGWIALSSSRQLSQYDVNDEGSICLLLYRLFSLRRISRYPNIALK